MIAAQEVALRVSACEAAHKLAIQTFDDEPTPSRAAEVDIARQALERARYDLELTERAEVGRVRLEQRRALEAKQSELRSLREAAAPAHYYEKARALLGAEFIEAVGRVEFALAELDALTATQAAYAREANERAAEIGDRHEVHEVAAAERDRLVHVVLAHASIGSRLARALLPRAAAQLAEQLDLDGSNSGRARQLRPMLERCASEINMPERLALDGIADSPCAEPAWNDAINKTTWDATRAVLGLTNDAA